MYSDQAGKFPCASRIGNKGLMIVHVVDANVILAEPFKHKTSQQLTEACLKLKKELCKRGFIINMRILDNEASTLFKDSIYASLTQ